LCRDLLRDLLLRDLLLLRGRSFTATWIPRESAVTRIEDEAGVPLPRRGLAQRLR